MHNYKTQPIETCNSTLMRHVTWHRLLDALSGWQSSHTWLLPSLLTDCYLPGAGRTRHSKAGAKLTIPRDKGLQKRHVFPASPHGSFFWLRTRWRSFYVQNLSFTSEAGQETGQHISRNLFVSSRLEEDQDLAYSDLLCHCYFESVNLVRTSFCTNELVRMLRTIAFWVAPTFSLLMALYKRCAVFCTISVQFACSTDGLF